MHVQTSAMCKGQRYISYLELSTRSHVPQQSTHVIDHVYNYSIYLYGYNYVSLGEPLGTLLSSMGVDSISFVHTYICHSNLSTIL